KLFGVKKGETEYTFNALPIGGFVKIFGENYEDVGPASEEDSRGFSSRPKWAQALVLVAGVTMNILFAWFLFSLTYMIGVQTPVDESQASESAELYITGVLPDSPAAKLPPGSRITAVEYEDRKIVGPDASEFSNLITEAGDKQVTLTYEYAGDETSVGITPVQGLIETDPDKFIVGTSLSMVDVVKKPFFTAIGDGFTSTLEGLVAIASGLFNLIKEALVGEADFTQVAGPVGIVGMVGDAASFGFTTLLTFTAIISLNLAVINLLPFPALDGGRLVFVIIETITGKRIPPEWAGRVNLVGFAILMLLMIAVTYNDIVRLL
ncbi:site-2 protease family protein, partial [Candidatus Kaiserbacteria bacterium]|nr:site-2 protease family protein [Candidatus Kaiserbacteria bacterium]